MISEVLDRFPRYLCGYLLFSRYYTFVSFTYNPSLLLATLSDTINLGLCIDRLWVEKLVVRTRASITDILLRWNPGHRLNLEPDGDGTRSNAAL